MARNQRAERESAQPLEPDSVNTDGGIVKEYQQMRYAFSIDCVSYQKKTVLAQQDFSIPVNKWTALVGKSGQGKTTLLKTLLRLVPGLKTSPDGLALSYMPQRDLLLPWKTVIDNVVLGATLRQETPNLTRAKSLLNDVGLADEAQNHPHYLSVGMRQRVALARTLMEDADLILMDEPFCAVDHQTRDQLRTLAKTQLSGKTVLIVSHDPDEVAKVADHVLTLSGKPAVCLSDS